MGRSPRNGLELASPISAIRPLSSQIPLPSAGANAGDRVEYLDNLLEGLCHTHGDRDLISSRIDSELIGSTIDCGLKGISISGPNRRSHVERENAHDQFEFDWRRQKPK
jgi:hypothetical protein